LTRLRADVKTPQPGRGPRLMKDGEAKNTWAEGKIAELRRHGGGEGTPDRRRNGWFQ